ncbi:hypothetical protein MTX26_01695 [Bradyrhizobium sp. ISRA443]|uniref:hypothetical protein n=1 Tax=unclassified Bradyrhizobium TaxID=2631580 RepID=UPI002478C621|nr:MULTISPECIES: hypothetical protein [unclassified Bradyrhizobium]WGR99612.1 hypothetical protein MTX23_01695 [Bradyrhizobium sp. ISRA436]WGS06502.1 hypothetical protein MTX18_01695 [Bradyrhizobium sp. ISRA437]WGS13386.1 hypothetical protein MTX26_01695 [Bradyrhizobium sp. ISRA443]
MQPTVLDRMRNPYPSPTIASTACPGNLLSFTAFALHCRSVAHTPRGKFLALLKSWIDTEIVPDFTSWRDFFRWLDRRGVDRDTIQIARGLWTEYQKQEVPLPQIRRGTS